jgi:hypothetical protein
LPSGQGSTSLVGGSFYDAGGGGPALPGCPPEPDPTAIAGTVSIEDATGSVIATETLAAGQTFDVAVSPGEYTVIGRESSASGGETGCESRAVTVVAGQVTPIYCWLVFP